MWKRWTVLAALPVCVLMSGCELRTQVGIVVDGDGAGALSYTLAADDELRRAARRAGADPLEALAATGEGLPGWRVDRGTEGALQGVTLTTTYDDPADLARISDQFANALAAPELRPLGPLRLVMDDSTVDLRGSAALVLDAAAVRELSLRPARAREVLDDSVTLRVEARMPGDVLETNADARGDDDSVSWTIAPGQRRTLHVVALRPWTLARLSRLLITAEGVLALAIGIALLYGWRRATQQRPALPA
ncbi:MAG TPA: hypothetical protein VK923_15200 [Euzebyales bacterium]|nr:hypothetical protein [Euzebyales bacterium]